MAMRDRITLTAVEAWSLSPATRVWIGGNNTDARREIELIAGLAERPPTGALDRAMIAPSSSDEAVYFARKLRPRLTSDSSLWIVLPKRGSTSEHLFTGSIEDLSVPMFELGYVDKGLATLGDHYTSLGFQLDRELG